MTDEDVRVTVRTATSGIVQLERHDGRWLCSCGRQRCEHEAHAESALADIDYSRRLDTRTAADAGREVGVRLDLGMAASHDPTSARLPPSWF